MTDQNNDILSILDTNEDILNSFDLKSNNFEIEVENFKIIFSKKINNILQNDVLEVFSENNNNILEEISEKNNYKFLNSLKFLFKYALTSTMLFVVLTVGFNYSAYIQRAKSYFTPEVLIQSKSSLQESLQTQVIVEEEKNEEELVKESFNKQTSLTSELSEVESKTIHSMSNLLFEDDQISGDFNIDILPYENRIVIPKIGKNIPLLDVKSNTVKNVKELEDTFMKDLEDWVVRYPWSAKPGEVWNTFIFGHSSNFPWMPGNYNDVFALLDKVVYNDEVIVFYNQKKYVYKIREKTIVKPGDVSVLKRDKWKAEITLMTCWPVWTTANRMLIVWELVSE